MSRRQPSQRERVLAALRRAGAEGVSTTDFLPPDVIDGGQPILRVPSRVDELRQRGHDIETVRQRSGVARYVLRPPSSAPPLCGVVELPAPSDDPQLAIVLDGPQQAQDAPVAADKWERREGFALVCPPLASPPRAVVGPDEWERDLFPLRADDGRAAA